LLASSIGRQSSNCAQFRRFRRLQRLLADALNDRPGGSIRPLVAGDGHIDRPGVVPVVDRGQRRNRMTISRAGCFTASIAARTRRPGTRSGRVSLCTTQTALILCAVSAASASPMRARRRAPPVGIDEHGVQTQPLRHLLPQRREPTGAAHQDGVAGERVLVSAASHARCRRRGRSRPGRRSGRSSGGW